MLPKRIYAKINLDNIEKNVDLMRKSVGKDTRLMGIVKADAYGHGAIEVAELLSETDVKDFGVATVKEAEILKKAGINGRILILGHIYDEGIDAVIENGFDCTIFDIPFAQTLSNAAVKTGKKANVYIKIDVGMGRIGFQPDENGFEQIKTLYTLNGLNILGAFAHFPCADKTEKAVSENQRQKFFDFTDMLISEGYPLACRHIYNSAAAIDLDGKHGDMVRMGIAMYGLYPSNEMTDACTLYPAMELKSSIAYIKNVPAGFTVSYGSTYVTDRPTSIATVSAGYADGYPRYLSNKGEVLVHGKRCPIIGRVCMDQFMIDVSDIPDAKIGDEVTLFGTDSGETIFAEDIADPTARFNYELVCLINKRVPRVYVRDGKVIKIKCCEE